MLWQIRPSHLLNLSLELVHTIHTNLAQGPQLIYHASEVLGVLVKLVDPSYLIKDSFHSPFGQRFSHSSVAATLPHAKLPCCLKESHTCCPSSGKYEERGIYAIGG